jgi:hypothetical protein
VAVDLGLVLLQQGFGDRGVVLGLVEELVEARQRDALLEAERLEVLAALEQLPGPLGRVGLGGDILGQGGLLVLVCRLLLLELVQFDGRDGREGLGEDVGGRHGAVVYLRIGSDVEKSATEMR